MKTQLNTLLLILFLTGCATLTGDPLVINAERVRSAAFEVFDAFLKLEYDNREYLAKWPQLRKTADFIGEQGPKLINLTTDQIKAYKQSRSYADRGVLESSVGAIKGLTTLANNAMAESLTVLSTNTITQPKP